MCSRTYRQQRNMLANREESIYANMVDSMAASVDTANQSVRSLEALADVLRDSVMRFKV